MPLAREPSQDFKEPPCFSELGSSGVFGKTARIGYHFDCDTMRRQALFCNRCNVLIALRMGNEESDVSPFNLGSSDHRTLLIELCCNTHFAISAKLQRKSLIANAFFPFSAMRIDGRYR